MQTKLIVPTIFNSDNSEATAIASGSSLANPWRRLKLLSVSTVKLVQGWYATQRQRQALYQLSDHLLKDIGISRYEALKEAEKPFWR